MKIIINLSSLNAACSEDTTRAFLVNFQH